MDSYIVTAVEKIRYAEQFAGLKPINGLVSGDQAKGFLLQSQLPPLVLGKIWELADSNADGKLDFVEFGVACKLINLKLRGFELPATLPTSLKHSLLSAHGSVASNPASMNPSLSASPVPQLPIQAQLVNMSIPMPVMNAPLVQPSLVGFAAPNVMPTSIPVLQSTAPINPVPPNVLPLSGIAQPANFMPSVAQLVGVAEPTLGLSRKASLAGQDSDWAVPRATEVKYTQIFNNTDRNKTGFLTGMQARGLLVQSQLPQALLAKIWGLSDMDGDGRLSCDEFILAMHLCELARTGDVLPDVLPANMIPPSFHKLRSASIISSEGINMSPAAQFVKSEPVSSDDSKITSPVSFEDKRKENFDKGQAELEKRRKALADAQRREQEERLRVEREEQARVEKLRQEQEKKRLIELEKLAAKQMELERERESERLKVLEQREAARREMERQRQLEWQRQRMQELLLQRQKEQERLMALKAKNQTLTIELAQLNDKVKELGSKIGESRENVAVVKNEIDGMRITRDIYVNEIGSIKNKLREQNQVMLTLHQEKSRLDSKQKTSSTPSGDPALIQSCNARQMALKLLKDKLNDLQEEAKKKAQDMENNNFHLTSVQKDVTKVVNNCQDLYVTYSAKRQQVLAMKLAAASQKALPVWDDAPPPTAGWGEESDLWPPKESKGFSPNDLHIGKAKYRALYEFVSRNVDELSFQPGDIIWVSEGDIGEPGWLRGELQGVSGWFPEAYVEKLESDVSATAMITNATTKRPLEGIQELPENMSDNGSLGDASAGFSSQNNSSNTLVLGLGKLVEGVRAQALFAWTGEKFDHLSLQPGVVVTIIEQQDDWWYGEFDDTRGWFPKTYVQVLEEEPVEVPKGIAADEYYVALFPYDSAEPGDLCFSAGEAIHVIRKDGDWWTGNINGREGIFPSNYVQRAVVEEPVVVTTVLDMQNETVMDNEVEAATATMIAREHIQKSPPKVTSPPEDYAARPATVPVDNDGQELSASSPHTPGTCGAASPSIFQQKGRKPEIATVVAPYTATSSEQLSLQRGQLIMIKKKSTSGWWEGELQAKGRKRQVGWFPASYVKVLSSGSTRTTPVPMEMRDDGEDTPTLPTIPTHSPAVPPPVLQETVIALFPYTAQNQDELSFVAGDAIQVISKDEASWWRGSLRNVMGLFPANYVESSPSSQQLPVLSSLTPLERKRQDHIRELIATEETYMKDMSIVLDTFRKPLARAAVLTTEDLDTIFVNWKELIMASNKSLRAFRVRKKMSTNGIVQMVGDILCENLPHMAPYIRFCSRQLSGAALLQKKFETSPEFAKVLKDCQKDPRAQGMPLSSFLLKPMQRITKYPLLIKKILESTDGSHPDRIQLEEAFGKAELLCSQINEGVREQENSDRLEWLQKHVVCEGLPEPLVFPSLTNILGPRKLVHYGYLKKPKSGKELMGFLFNDFLLLTQANKPLANLNMQYLFASTTTHSFRIYKKPLFLNETLISTTEDSNLSEGFSVQDLENKVQLAALSTSEKTLWLKRLEESRRSFIEVERAVLQRQKSKRSRTPVARLRVIVVEGVGLALKHSKGKNDPYCEVTMGSQEHRTKVVANTVNPKWNASMQFLVKDLRQDVLCFTVFDKDYFSPNEFLGRTEFAMWEVYQCGMAQKGPVTKRLPLHEVECGDIVVKLDLQLFE